MKILSAVALSLVASPTIAQPLLGDPDLGRQMAIEICSECHNVVPSPEVERVDAPRSFTAIAKDPLYTTLSLRVFLSSPHIQMPNFIFTREQQDHLIAYLMKMREDLLQE